MDVGGNYCMNNVYLRFYLILLWTILYNAFFLFFSFFLLSLHVIVSSTFVVNKLISQRHYFAVKH